MTHYADQHEAQARAREKEYDAVNKPFHYNQFPIEVIELTEHLNFCRGNVVKYVCRAALKGQELEDLKKAQWYLEREIVRLENKPLAVKKERPWSSLSEDDLGFVAL